MARRGPMKPKANKPNRWHSSSQPIAVSSLAEPSTCTPVALLSSFVRSSSGTLRLPSRTLDQASRRVGRILQCRLSTGTSHFRPICQVLSAAWPSNTCLSSHFWSLGIHKQRRQQHKPLAPESLRRSRGLFGRRAGSSSVAPVSLTPPAHNSLLAQTGKPASKATVEGERASNLFGKRSDACRCGHFAAAPNERALRFFSSSLAQEIYDSKACRSFWPARFAKRRQM